jgi:hypothetical protein
MFVGNSYFLQSFNVAKSTEILIRHANYDNYKNVFITILKYFNKGNASLHAYSNVDYYCGRLYQNTFQFSVSDQH